MHAQHGGGEWTEEIARDDADPVEARIGQKSLDVVPFEDPDVGRAFDHRARAFVADVAPVARPHQIERADLVRLSRLERRRSRRRLVQADEQTAGAERAVDRTERLRYVREVMQERVADHDVELFWLEI